MNQAQFKFRRNQKIGSADAEDDLFLGQCFVETGDLDVLLDTADPKSVVLGRTGSGKTALLMRVKSRKDNVQFLSPEDLSLQYLSNDGIVKILDESGVNLELFFRLLWKHIFVVELIRVRYDLRNDQDFTSFWNRINIKISKDKLKKYSLDYVTKWNKSFWKDTHARITELTEKLAEELQSKLGGKYSDLSAFLSKKSSLSSEMKTEIKTIGQEIVDSLQIRELNNLVKIITEDMTDNPQKEVFILVDKLDENWVHNNLRFRLIRALLEVVKDFSKIKYAKLIIAIREDLLQRVIANTRSEGFQEEKYKTFYLNIFWSKEHLFSILEKRINCLIQKTYKGGNISWQELLPDKVDGYPIMDYLINRTLYRPRDLVEFFNYCIDRADGLVKLSAGNVKNGEADYSKARVESLTYEWSGMYPQIKELITVLYKEKHSFTVNSLSTDAVENLILSANTLDSTDPLTSQAKMVSTASEVSTFKYHVSWILYQTGIVGLVLPTDSKVQWSFRRFSGVVFNDVNDETKIKINPTFYRALGIKSPKKT